MRPRLPADLITRVKPLLLPYVGDKAEREALFIETYFLRDPRPINQINFEGSAEVFTIRCIADLVHKIGCLAETGEQQHALAALLMTVRSRCEARKHAEIDALVAIANAICAEANRPPDAKPVTPAASPAPTQTVDTPRDERRPAVFVSYSHADDTFAQQLVTDLKAAGHACWIDTSAIKGGADWQKAICDGINLSYALVVVCTHRALESEYVWDEIQWARTRRKHIIPVLLEDVTGDDRFFGLHRYQGIRFDRLRYAEALAELLTALPGAPDIDPAAPVRAPSRREYELAYLDRLRFEDFRLEKFELAEYAPLPGVSQQQREVGDEWQALAMQQEFAVIRAVKRGGEEAEGPPESFTDAVSRITALRRAVVLGEPGAGKTHTLRAIAKPLYTAALSDPSAPIPVLVKLGNWDRPDEAFEHFLRRALGELGAYLDALFEAGRAILLLDGLNEFPADQREKKYPQVEAFIQAHPDVMAVVTCREADYPFSLHLHKVLIRPLDPLRIRDFARRALRVKGEAEGDAFFWKLVGEDARRFEARFMARFADKLADWEHIFWLAHSLPDDLKWESEFVNTFYYGWSQWCHLRDKPSGILTLARNPYMLRMLLDVYIQYRGVLPANRGQLFDQFVNVLLEREKLATIDAETQAVTLTDEGRALLAGLQQVAFEMQVQRAETAGDGESSAGTALPLERVRMLLSDRLLYLAVSTSILASGDEVRFTHQLLQEYFAARYMDIEIAAGRLQAHTIWPPERWWESTNWEEAVILLAGLYSDDCTPVVAWVNAANPEVATQCVTRSGAKLADATRERLRAEWISRLTDLKRDPDPRARAAVGRALGLTNWDNRKGVNVVFLPSPTSSLASGTSKLHHSTYCTTSTRYKGPGVRALPDIDWVTIPAGEFSYQDGRMTLDYDFQIARYPVTYAQFQTFTDDPEGFTDGRWWDGLAHREGHNSAPGEQQFKYWNHPREGVSWYDAMAFCRWLSWRLGGEYSLDAVDQWAVRLPTEFEWERAARGTDGREYPYEGKFDTAKGNTPATNIRQTSAVGIFPNGAAPEGVLDMSGNVWNWCLTDYSNPQGRAADEDIRSNARRVLRGGSWNRPRHLARAVYRGLNVPDHRSISNGFRVVCVRAPQAET